MSNLNASSLNLWTVKMNCRNPALVTSLKLDTIGLLGSSSWVLILNLLYLQAAQNLVVLAREDAGAEKIFQSDGVRLLVRLLDIKKSDMMLAALRTLVGLCTGHQPRVSLYSQCSSLL